MPHARTNVDQIGCSNMPDTAPSLNSTALIHLIANLDECIELVGTADRLSIPDIRLKSILVATRRQMVCHLAQRIESEEGPLLPDGSGSPFGAISGGQIETRRQ